MISGIRLLNFQGFRGDQRIELGDINLVFGPNSSGKSSLARALQIMSQSLERLDPKIPFLIPVYDGVQINVRQENLMYGRDLNPYLDFGFGIKLHNEFVGNVWFSIIEASTLHEDDIFNEFEFMPDGNPDNKITCILVWNREDPKSPIMKFGRSEEAKFIDWFKSFQNPFSLVEGISLGLFSSREAFFKDAYPNFHQEIHRRFGSEGFLDQAERQQESQEFEVEFLNLFREVTAEIDHIPDYIFEREAPLKSGEVFLRLLIERAYFSTLEEARSQLKDLEVVDPVRIVPKGMDSSDVFPEEFVDSISKDLLHITDGRYSLGQQRWSVQDKVEYFWNVVDHFTGTSTGLENVGQGITQILEVLVTLRLGSGLIVLQQPDLHLHPKAVGNLGDLIFRTIANDVFSDKRLIIETHSESLLTRLQKHKRLSLTHPDLTASDLAFKVFYCEPVPPAIIDQNLIDELSDAGLPWAFLDYVKDNVSRRFDIRGFDWSRVDFVELSKEAREAMSDFAGFNFISELRVDHLGDVIDPFPISFTDLRVQDLLS